MDVGLHLGPIFFIDFTFQLEAQKGGSPTTVSGAMLALYQASVKTFCKQHDLQATNEGRCL